MLRTAIETEYDVNNVREVISDVNSMNLSGKVSLCMRLITDINVAKIDKVKVFEFLCSKLYDVYNMSDDKSAVIIRELEDIVLNGADIAIATRLGYLHYRNTRISFKTSINAFHNNVGEHMTRVHYFQILKFIIKIYPQRGDDVIGEEVFTELEEIFNHADTSTYDKMDIADIFLLNSRNARGEEMLNEIRDEPIRPRVMDPLTLQPVKKARVKTVYGDSQNVHAGEVNTSVLKACRRLLDIELPNILKQSNNSTSLFHYDEKLTRTMIFGLTSPDQEAAVETVLERISMDVSRFKSGETSYFSLYDVFSALISYITRHKSAYDLTGRLIEEMESMEKYCSTGHLARLINVIQGFTDDEELCIRISDRQQIKAVVARYLDTGIANASDDVMESMMEADKRPFFNFIVTEMNKHIPGLISEYGSVEEHIISSIAIYSDWKGWTISNNILKIITVYDDRDVETESEDGYLNFI